MVKMRMEEREDMNTVTKEDKLCRDHMMYGEITYEAIERIEVLYNKHKFEYIWPRDDVDVHIIKKGDKVTLARYPYVDNPGKVEKMWINKREVKNVWKYNIRVKGEGEETIERLFDLLKVIEDDENSSTKDTTKGLDLFQW